MKNEVSAVCLVVAVLFYMGANCATTGTYLMKYFV